MAELKDETHQQIVQLCSEGDELAAQQRFSEAIANYSKAWCLLPDPQTEWEASTWILAALGDALFLSGRIEEAREALEFSMLCPAAIGNPFLHLRLGQVRYEEGDLDRAADELMRAYMGAGEDAFAAEDPKYRTFLATRAILDNS